MNEADQKEFMEDIVNFVDEYEFTLNEVIFTIDETGETYRIALVKPEDNVVKFPNEKILN